MALVAEPAKHAAQHVLAGRQAGRETESLFGCCVLEVFIGREPTREQIRELSQAASL